MLNDDLATLTKLNNSKALERAIKTHFTTVQSTVDSITAQITEAIQEEFKTYLVASQKDCIECNDGEVVLCGLLIPEFGIEADDIAPFYDLQIANTWYISTVMEDTGTKERWLETTCIRGHFYDIVEELHGMGLNIIYERTPAPAKKKLVLEYLNKNKMVERFSILSPAVDLI